MKLTIKQKQVIYEHLLTLDCPDLLAALIAERSDTLIRKENTLAECIQIFAWWRNTTETYTFWEHIYDEVVDMGKVLNPLQIGALPVHQRMLFTTKVNL